MAAKLLIGFPSKGRLKDAAADLFARSNLALRSKGHERRYRGAISGLDDVDAQSASCAGDEPNLLLSHDGSAFRWSCSLVKAPGRG